MKTRNGFVSNSSSSSYIIKSPTLTTSEVAIAMLQTMLKEECDEGFYTDDEEDWHIQRIKLFESTIEYLQIHSEIKNKNLYIPWSCNYETEIYRHLKGDSETIYVETCNNYSWDWPEEWEDYVIWDEYFGDNISCPNNVIDLSKLDLDKFIFINKQLKFKEFT